jgi:hypothetical protein
MKKFLKRDLKVKKLDRELRAGTEVEVSFPREYDGRVVSYEAGGVRILSRSESLGRTIDIKIPGEKALAKWDSEGYSKSVGGKVVEPDGWDNNGMPSWLLVLGLV